MVVAPQRRPGSASYKSWKSQPSGGTISPWRSRSSVETDLCKMFRCQPRRLLVIMSISFLKQLLRGLLRQINRDLPGANPGGFYSSVDIPYFLFVLHLQGLYLGASFRPPERTANRPYRELMLEIARRLPPVVRNRDRRGCRPPVVNGDITRHRFVPDFSLRMMSSVAATAESVTVKVAAVVDPAAVVLW